MAAIWSVYDYDTPFGKMQLARFTSEGDYDLTFGGGDGYVIESGSAGATEDPDDLPEGDIIAWQLEGTQSRS